MKKAKFEELVQELIEKIEIEFEVKSTWGNAEVTFEDGSEYVIYDYDKQVDSIRYVLEDTTSHSGTEFLSNITGIREEVFELLIEEDRAVLAIIEGTCGVDVFVEEYIRLNGTGELIAHYDGIEIELSDGYSAFRVS